MKNILITLLILFSFAPLIGHTQGINELFEARVLEIVDERDLESEDGVIFHQQNLKLIGLEKEMRDQEFTVNGISDFEFVDASTYEVGDTVIVMNSIGPDNEETYFITDYVRRTPLLWLVMTFILSVLAVARLKGLRALLVLTLTFFIIIKGIIPLLLQGYNPLLVSTSGAVLIGALAIFGTEGLKKKSYASFISIVASFGIVLALSQLFTKFSRLTGVTEESAMLLGMNTRSIDLQGLLLAGIILGSIGVLDDVVISQVSAVKELTEANPRESNKNIFKRAMRIGTDHINALVNTLFLAYAGAALPLLVLFTLNEPPFVTFGDVINNELLASEIVRTLSGSIALILAVPLSTYIALRTFKKS